MFQEYDPGDFYDEMFSGPGEVRPHYGRLLQRAEALSVEDFDRKRQIAERSYLNQGITFTVYNDKHEGTERIFPFDLVPRIIPGNEWRQDRKSVV